MELESHMNVQRVQKIWTKKSEILKYTCSGHTIEKIFKCKVCVSKFAHKNELNDKALQCLK
jgi:hypothetical protein